VYEQHAAQNFCAAFCMSNERIWKARAGQRRAEAPRIILIIFQLQISKISTQL
jgi:hypothetical protein